eukprot:362000-Chlamydomonas_euryale.AAC.4
MRWSSSSSSKVSCNTSTVCHSTAGNCKYLELDGIARVPNASVADGITPVNALEDLWIPLRQPLSTVEARVPEGHSAIQGCQESHTVNFTELAGQRWCGQQEHRYYRSTMEHGVCKADSNLGDGEVTALPAAGAAGRKQGDAAELQAKLGQLGVGAEVYERVARGLAVQEQKGAVAEKVHAENGRERRKTEKVSAAEATKALQQITKGFLELPSDPRTRRPRQPRRQRLRRCRPWQGHRRQRAECGVVAGITSYKNALRSGRGFRRLELDSEPGIKEGG